MSYFVRQYVCKFVWYCMLMCVLVQLRAGSCGLVWLGSSVSLRVISVLLCVLVYVLRAG